MSRIIAVASALFAFSCGGLRKQLVVENLYQFDSEQITDANGEPIQVNTWPY